VSNPRAYVFPDPEVFPPEEALGEGRRLSLDAFLAVILGEQKPAGGAAFADAVLREYSPDQPRDYWGRWTTGGSGGPSSRRPGGGGMMYVPPEAPSSGRETVVAGPAGKSGKAPTVDEWFEKNIWGPIQRHGGTRYSKDYMKDVLSAGCIGLATLATAGQFHPRDPKTGAVLDKAVPDVRKGFSTLDEAKQYQDKQNKENPITSDGTTISGQAPRWRIFALLYSSKNETYPTAEPTKGADGSYDLSRNDVLLTIVDRSGPNAHSNFDFFTYSEPGDPWYNADRQWLHADEGGDKMTLKATDEAGIKSELGHNESDFDKLFYFVAPERQFPRRR